jgi:transcriptional regulator with XRE-family HTH domain
LREASIPVSSLETLCVNIILRRAREHVSQAELAERSGVSLPTISRIERALTGLSVGVVERLASALGTTVADLLTPNDMDADDEEIIRRARDEAYASFTARTDVPTVEATSADLTLTFALEERFKPVPNGFDLRCQTLPELEIMCFDGHLTFTVGGVWFVSERWALPLISLLTSFVGVVYRLKTNTAKTWLEYEGGTSQVIFELDDNGIVTLSTNFSDSQARISCAALISELTRFIRTHTSLLLEVWPELKDNRDFAEHVLAATRRASAGEAPFPWEFERVWVPRRTQ